MNKGAKGDIPSEATILQKLIHSPGHLNYSSKYYKNIILLYNEKDK